MFDSRPRERTSFLAEFRRLLFPTVCVVCSSPDEILCADCEHELEPRLELVSATNLNLPVLVSAGPYFGAVATVIRRFKETGNSSLAAVLAHRLRMARDLGLTQLESGFGPAQYLYVPPPATRVNLRSRGFEPLQVLFRHSGMTYAREITVVRQRVDQSKLSMTQRHLNTYGTFRARRDLRGRECILVDDVTTSGATLREMTRVLTNAGAIVRGAVVVAHTVRRSSPN